MREDPSSVFASDIVIENSNGPVDYDLSRIYSGKLEGEFHISQASVKKFFNRHEFLMNKIHNSLFML